MIQIKLAHPDVIEMPEGKIGAHDEIPHDLPLNAQVDVQRRCAGTSAGLKPSALLGQLDRLNRSIRIGQVPLLTRPESLADRSAGSRR